MLGRWVFPPADPAVASPTAPAVTIDAEPKVASAGHSLTITGSIVVRQRGERVRLEENPCGRGWRYLQLVETDESGNWAVVPSSSSSIGEGVFASMRTAYRAVWRGARSSAVTVAVRPVVQLRYRGPSSLEAMVPAAASLAGRRITFQRLVQGRWRDVRQVRLREEERPYGRTYVARVRPSLPRGSRVRAALTLEQARPCYVGAFSNVLTID